MYLQQFLDSHYTSVVTVAVDLDHIMLGCTSGMVTGTQRLPRLVGLTKAIEMMLVSFVK